MPTASLYEIRLESSPYRIRVGYRILPWNLPYQAHVPMETLAALRLNPSMDNSSQVIQTVELWAPIPAVLGVSAL